MAGLPPTSTHNLIQVSADWGVLEIIIKLAKFVHLVMSASTVPLTGDGDADLGAAVSLIDVRDGRGTKCFVKIKSGVKLLCFLHD